MGDAFQLPELPQEFVVRTRSIELLQQELPSACLQLLHPGLPGVEPALLADEPINEPLAEHKGASVLALGLGLVVFPRHPVEQALHVARLGESAAEFWEMTAYGFKLIPRRVWNQGCQQGPPGRTSATAA